MKVVNLAILALIIVLVGSGCGPQNSEARILQHADSILDRLSQETLETAAQVDALSKGIKQNKERVLDAVSKFVASCDESDLPVIEEIAEFMDVFSAEVLTVATEVSKDKSKALTALGLRHRARLQKLYFKSKNFKPGTLNAFSEFSSLLISLKMESLSDMKQFMGIFASEKSEAHPHHDEHEHEHEDEHQHGDDDHEHGPGCKHHHHHH